MEAVYLLWHIHRMANGDDEEKLIGAYRTEADARTAIARLRHKPGFSETPEGFQIEPYELNKDHWVEGYVSA